MALVTVQRSPTPSATSSPCASEADSGEEECRSQPRSISESFLTVKGAALFLPRGNGSSTPRISHRRNKHAGDLQQHLQAMFILLRPEDNIRLAVRLESTYQNRTRYMVVVSTNGRQDTEESIVLGMDFSSNDSSTCTMGLVLPLWSDTLIHLDGDGGFSVSTDNRVHIFKPVSVQAMWSALQSLHKACEVARSNNYYPGSLFLTWVSYYESHINSDQSSVNEWNAMQDVQSHRPDSPALFTDVPTERERTERLIKTKLREIMMQKDLENITSKEIRTELEMQMVCNLREFKEFIDKEIIVILGQMDSPTQIFDHVFLGSEWNASNLEDLQNRGVRYILNVTREIDNFFPGLFEYHNIRVYDEEATDLLAYWNDTYKFISKAKKTGSKCLVHCKMGVSRSASTVIAYAMKEYGWNLDRAYEYVKERRTVTKPNPSFMRQLEEYQGILLASKQRHNKLWRSHSDSDLSDHHEPICKAGLELNKKEITTSADQISEAKTNDNQQPMSPIYSAELDRNQQLPADANTIEEMCVKERIHLEFTCRDFHTEQMEDKLNLNNINGCTAGCCVDSVPPDNCHASEALLQLQHPLEIAEFPDLTVDDLEKDALKPDVNVHLVPMEEFTSCLKDFPHSPNQNSQNLQQNPQPEVTELSADRIDFFSALEKFVELSQESRPRTCSHSRTEEQGSGRNGVSRVPVLEVLPTADGAAGAQRNSSGNTPQASDDSSADEEQQKEVPELPAAGQLTRSHSENAISVKEIITEIESINQAAGPAQQKEGSANLTQTPKRNTVHDVPVEAIWVSERLEQSEGACAGHQEKEKDSLQAEQETAPSLQPSSDKTDLEEGSSSGDPQEPHSSINPEPKWCPGSVRRATLEFEERLRQEQEHQHTAPVCLLPTRKNSRNDSPAAELLLRGKSEEPPLELAPEGDEPQGLGAEDPLLPPGAELPAEPRLGQEGTAQEHRTVVSFDGTEPLLPSLLPKKTEIIEYAAVVQAAEGPGASCEQGGLATAILPLDENLNPSLCLEKAPTCLRALLLGNPSVPEQVVHRQATFTMGSPSEEGAGSSAHLGAASPSAQVTSTPSATLDCSSYPYVIHLEGVTEQSTSTDDEPVTLRGTEGDASLPFRDRPNPLCEGGAGTSRQLSSEDFTTQHSENTDLLDISFLCYGLPHSSSSHSMEEHSSSSPGLVKQRAKEIEARIRHAGLTTPSHMKRSASLAKLDCLDLSKDDLSERRSASSDANPVFFTCVALGRGFCEDRLEQGSEGAGEKHCLSSPEPTRHFVEQLRTAECIAQSKPVERPLAQYAKECGSSQLSLFSNMDPTWTSSEEGPSLLQLQVLDSLPSPRCLAVTPRQQHGRTHPLRRLKKTNDKKRTTNPLYNTM